MVPVSLVITIHRHFETWKINESMKNLDSKEVKKDSLSSVPLEIIR